MQLITTQEFRKGLSAVLRALAGGETFLLVEDGRPIARLLPLFDGAVAQVSVEPPDIGPHLVPVLSMLGEASLSRVLGLTLPTFVLQQADGSFVPPIRERLIALSIVVEEQATYMTMPQMRAWWHRAHRGLRGDSPVEHLALPWVCGDARSMQVFDLIHRQRLLQEVQLKSTHPR